MPKEHTRIARFIQTWNTCLVNMKQKNQGFFGDLRNFKYLDGLFKSLQLSDTMSPDDLIKALQILESVPIKTKSEPSLVSMTQNLGLRNYRTLQSFNIATAHEVQGFCILENTNLHRFLIDNHQMLLDCYERSYFHIKGEVPVSVVDYSQDQLNESQAFYDMENTSQALELPDKSTIMGDLKRKGVTIYNAEILFGDVNNPRDPMAISSIEGFTGDSLVNPHSRASKLFNFGGQFLEAVMLREFSNTTKFTDSDISGLERGAVKGHINWSKAPATGEIYASITMKILSCSYADPSDKFAPQKIYAMGSDGTSLIEVDDDEMVKVLQRCSAEVRGTTEGNVTPICELQARVKLIHNGAGEGYMLKVDQFHSQYFTPDLVSTKAYQLSFNFPRG